MPVPTTRLTDIGAGDPQPLVLGRRRQHAAQQLTIAGLQLTLRLQRQARRGDPLGKRVAHLLQLVEAGNPRFGEMAGDRSVDDDARKGLGREAGELVLEAGDLAPQLGAREALVASHSKRRERLSIEQIWHKNESSLNHRPATEKEKLVKESARGVKPRSPRRRSREPRRWRPGARP